MGEFPHKCPSLCSVPAAAAAMGCAGALPYPLHTIKLANGEAMPIYECPHRLLSRTPDVGAAVGWFFTFVEHGTLPNDGGWFDQASGFDDVRAICGAARVEILEARAARDKGRG